MRRKLDNAEATVSVKEETKDSGRPMSPPRTESSADSVARSKCRRYAVMSFTR